MHVISLKCISCYKGESQEITKQKKESLKKYNELRISMGIEKILSIAVGLKSLLLSSQNCG